MFYFTGLLKKVMSGERHLFKWSSKGRYSLTSSAINNFIKD
jgi:hypothetical protein